MIIFDAVYNDYMQNGFRRKQKKDRNGRGEGNVCIIEMKDIEKASMILPY